MADFRLWLWTAATKRAGTAGWDWPRWMQRRKAKHSPLLVRERISVRGGAGAEKCTKITGFSYVARQPVGGARWGCYRWMRLAEAKLKFRRTDALSATAATLGQKNKIFRVSSPWPAGSLLAMDRERLGLAGWEWYHWTRLDEGKTAFRNTNSVATTGWPPGRKNCFFGVSNPLPNDGLSVVVLSQVKPAS